MPGERELSLNILSVDIRNLSLSAAASGVQSSSLSLARALLDKKRKRILQPVKTQERKVISPRVSLYLSISPLQQQQHKAAAKGPPVCRKRRLTNSLPESSASSARRAKRIIHASCCETKGENSQNTLAQPLSLSLLPLPPSLTHRERRERVTRVIPQNAFNERKKLASRRTQSDDTRAATRCRGLR